MIHLDTHVVVWLYAGLVKKLSKQARNLIESSNIYISPMVSLKLQMLHDIKRINASSNEIIAELMGKIDLKIAEQHFSPIVNAANQINWTRDPFDRIIVAHASLTKTSLISKDQRILDNYSQAVW